MTTVAYHSNLRPVHVKRCHVRGRHTVRYSTVPQKFKFLPLFRAPTGRVGCSSTYCITYCIRKPSMRTLFRLPGFARAYAGYPRIRSFRDHQTGPIISIPNQLSR